MPPPYISGPAYQRGVWADCPLKEFMFDQSIGVLYDERWGGYNAQATTGDWVLTQATTGTAAISTAAPGVLELDCNSTTSTQGAQIQRVKTVFLPAANKSIWGETTFKIVDTFDKVELFAGLSEVDTSIIASSANSSANHIGWQCVTDDGVLLFSAAKASTGATKACATIAEDTYIRLGFKYDGVSDTLSQWVNGVLVGTAHVTANIPKVALVPSFVCQSAGTNDPIMHIGATRIFQLR